MGDVDNALREWVDRLAAMKRFCSAAELAEMYPPAHKVQRGTMEIWHYPLGVAGEILYSIHVALAGEGALQVYMRMEPSEAPETFRKPRPWWALLVAATR